MDDKEGRLVARTALDALGMAGERVIDGKLLAVQVTLVLRDTNGSVRVLTTVDDDPARERSGRARRK